MAIVFRPVGSDDDEHVRWGLYTALDWDPEREFPPPEVVFEHPEAVRYHREWGRPGDFGVLATTDGDVVGIVYCRLFTDADHGHGYVDERTPEVAVAVRDDYRGRGLGGSLMAQLAEAARAAGYTQLSLSVHADNPARRLYERLGYRELSVHEVAVRMLLEIDD